MATELLEQQNSHEEMTSKKRGLDECHSDDEDDNDRQSRRGSLPPLKKRLLNVPASAEQPEDRVANKDSEDDLIANHPAIRAMNALKQGGKGTDAAMSLSPEDIAARLQAFEEAQRRSNVSRELLAKATQELQRAKQLQQQERMVKLMTLNAAMAANVNTNSSAAVALAPAPSPDPAGRVAAARLSLGSCGSRSGSMGAAGTDLAAFGAAAMTGAAW